MFNRSCRALAALGICVAVGVSSSARADEATLTDHQKVVHALNRLAYGPCPGDVERVEKMGLNTWIDQQLHPETIDDAKLGAKLQQFETLSLPAHELTSAYFNEIRRFIGMQQMSGNTDDIKLRTGFDVSKNKPQQEMPAGGMGGMILTEVARNVTLRGLGELQTAKVMRAAESERQLQEVLVDFWSNHFNVDVKKDPIRALKIVDDREVIRPHVLGKFRRLLGASAASPAMLVYLDNNENSAAHEVSAGEQKVRAAVIKGLIGIDDGAGMMKADKPMTEGGLNENYARELLELHTLGVDGGYTQKDVEEVARCFTGWSYNPFTGTYSFEDKRHDNGEKHVLGQTIAAGGGVKDGMQVLDLLASHPSTAKFIATKFCRRFIADDPPANAVERTAKVFLDTGGDLREVVRSVITSPEFNAKAAYRAKIKSPLEYAISAVRATGGTIEPRPHGIVTVQLRYVLEGAGTTGFNAETLSSSRIKTTNWHIFDMGQPLFACQPPTGYPEDSRKWVSTGALIARLNFATALCSGDVMDVTLPVVAEKTEAMNEPAEKAIEKIAKEYLSGDVTSSTRASLLKQAAKQTNPDEAQLRALVLGSPEFQRR